MSTLKLTLEEVEKRCGLLNLKLLNREYKNSFTPLELISEDGYKFLTSIHSISKNHKPRIFHPKNPYTLHNINLFLKINNIKYKLKENQTYKSCDSKLIFICNQCGEFEQKWSYIKENKNCPVCIGKIVKIGINDIATTDPNIVKYFKNENDSTLFTRGSGKKCDFVCTDCGFEKNMAIYTITVQGFSCNRCSDGMSTPNKFLVGIFSQLKFYFKPEKSFKDSNYRYDLYVKTKEQNYTIEAHGGQHYIDDSFGVINSLNAQQKIDKEKRLFSESLGNIHIEVDCRKSDFKFLKEQFIKSLSPYFNLSDIDWNKVYENCTISMIFKACKLWKKYKNTNKVASILKISNSTAVEYFKKGTNLNICSYDPKFRKKGEKNKKNMKSVVQYSLNNEKIKQYESIKDAQLQTGATEISTCCNNKQKTSKGFIWKWA